MRQEPKLFSSGKAEPQQQDGFHVEPRRQPAARHHDEDERPSRRRGFPWHLLIGVVVLAVIGIVVWQGAGLLSGTGGDGAGGVPVFEASVDPFKHRPDDPGGMDVPNQNVTVYDTLDTAESADGMEQLLPEPEEPIAIAPEAVEGADTVLVEGEEGVIDVGNTATAEIQATEEGAEPIFTADQVSALVDEAMTGAQGDIPIPLEKPVVPAGAPASTQTIVEEAPAEAAGTGGGLSFSDVAASLGENGGTATQTTQAPPEDAAGDLAAALAAEVPETTETTGAAATVEAAPSGDGTYWVQVAAYSTRDAAAAGWERLARQNADLVGSATPRVMETSVAGTTLHRLQIGAYASQGEAQRVCDELVKRTGDQCMIVGP